MISLAYCHPNSPISRSIISSLCEPVLTLSHDLSPLKMPSLLLFVALMPHTTQFILLLVILVFTDHFHFICTNRQFSFFLVHFNFMVTKILSIGLETQVMPTT